MHQPLPAATLPRELRPYLDLVNQVFEIEKKVGGLMESNSIQRNVRNMRAWLEQEIRLSMGGQPAVASFTYHNPLGESYDETRSDCDASIAGTETDNLVITEVIKPIVWFAMSGTQKVIVQQAVVVVEAKQSSATPVIQPKTAVNDTASFGLSPGSTFTFGTQPLDAKLDQSNETSPPVIPTTDPSDPEPTSIPS